MFEIFAAYSNDNADDLWQKIVDLVKEEPERWEHLGKVVLQMNFIDLDTCLKVMEIMTTSID